jgi:glycosyltransferase involved in cell wall biosynthesis
MPSPLVSVNMCAYNVAPYLEETIHSILNQTYRNIEFIMVDDCSTDDTLAIMQQYAALDNRIKVLRNAENMGMSRSRNVCLAHSSGKYIAIQDANDISLPHRIETQVNYLEQPGHEQVGYCGAWLEHFGTETAISKYPDLYLKEMQLSNCMFGHPSTMFRMALIDKYKLFFDAKHGPANDYGIQTALVPYTDFHNVQEVLVRYRQHATNASNNRQLMFDKAREIREGQFRRLYNTDELPEAEQQNINDFFVRFQYQDKASADETVALIKWMDKVVAEGSKCAFYTNEGLVAVMAHFYFKLFARQEKKTIRTWAALIVSPYFRALFKTYTLRDLIYLLRK